MFVYKITNKHNGMVYIGVDTKPERLQRRWKHHLRIAASSNRPSTKLYDALHGNVEDFSYEVVFRGENAGELFLKEIELIATYDSFRNGYNSTEGGDCFGTVVYGSAEYNELVSIFRTRRKAANKLRWDGKTLEERKEMTSHLHRDEVYAKKSKSIKGYWDEVDSGKKTEHLTGLLDYIANNKDVYAKYAQNASDAARLKNIKPIKLQDLESGETYEFSSQREAKSALGIDINYIIKKHRLGKADKKWKVLDGV